MCVKLSVPRKLSNIWTPSCKIWRPWGEMRQISRGGSQERQHAITMYFQGYNKHSPKNLSQIQEDQRYPIYLTAPCHWSHLVRGALDTSKGGHCVRKGYSSSVAIWPKRKYGFEKEWQKEVVSINFNSYHCCPVPYEIFIFSLLSILNNIINSLNRQRFLKAEKN